MLGLGIIGVICLVGGFLLGRGDMATHILGWPLFVAVTFSGWMYQFGRNGDGLKSHWIESIGMLGTIVVLILAFVFVGWKLGVASIILWFSGGFLGTLTVGLIRGGQMKTALGYIIAAILIIAFLGFFGPPEFCSGRSDSEGNLVRDSNGKVVSDCTPWLRYLLLGH